jgi:hypothetical protein
MDAMTIFVDRMRKLGILVELVGNFPWIYLDKVNGHRVTEKFEGNHGFTIAFSPIRPGQRLKFTDLGRVFEVVRKYAEL